MTINTKASRVLRIILQAAMVLLIIEVFLRIIFFQNTGRDWLAVIEQLKNLKRKALDKGPTVLYQQYYLARPDSGKAANEMIAAEVMASNKFEYHPWVEYKNIDFTGTYINTSGLNRKTVPDGFINNTDTTIRTIYFIGGSTIYGFNNTDKETIPSLFVDGYSKKFPKGHSIRVVNYGVSAYYSYHQLVLLSHLVNTNSRPDIIVVFDGLNDFFMSTAALNRWPYMYHRLRMVNNDRVSYREMEAVIDSTKTLFEYPANYASPGGLADTLLRSYLQNRNMMKQVSAANGIDAFFFVQPTPFYNYPNKKNDPICHPGSLNVIEHAYPLLEKSCDSTNQQYFLGNMLANETGYPFIDQFHYSPAMNRKIAGIMVDIVGKKINKPF